MTQNGKLLKDIMDGLHKPSPGRMPRNQAYAYPVQPDPFLMMQLGGGLLSKTVTCSSCGHSWKSVEGGLDPLNCHKCGGMIEMGKGGQHGGLDRWFAEKWVDVKTGKACGRQEDEKRKGYPACRPSRRINEDTPKTSSELSSAEREKFKRSKTSSQRINYQHRRKEDGGEITQTDMANKPNNPALWSRAKSMAKQKFDVYPSAYANGWAAKWYKSKGGTWRKAEYGMQVMEDGGKPEWLLEAQLKAQGFSGNALQQKMSSMAQGGEPQNAGFQALPEYVQDKIMAAAYGGYMPEMGYGGYMSNMFADGGEANGEMALGQMAAVQDKMNKLRQFVKADQNLDPWIASKLAVMDHSADAIADYMMYGPDAQQEDMPEMGKGGYTVTRSNDRKGKTHKVTGPDGTVKYFGDAKLGQHPRDPERKKAFYARHKKNLANNPYFRAFARKTWADGGEVYDMPEMKGGGSTFSGNAWYGYGGYMPEAMYGYGMAEGGENPPRRWHAEWDQDPLAGYTQIDPSDDEIIAAQDAVNTAANPMTMPQMNVPAPAQSAPAGRRGNSSGSIVDFLNSQGAKSDFATRKAVAE